MRRTANRVRLWWSGVDRDTSLSAIGTYLCVRLAFHAVLGSGIYLAVFFHLRSTP
jgi:hypothetical protein